MIITAEEGSLREMEISKKIAHDLSNVFPLFVWLVSVDLETGFIMITEQSLMENRKTANFKMAINIMKYFADDKIIYRGAYEFLERVYGKAGVTIGEKEDKNRIIAINGVSAIDTTASKLK